MILVWRVDTRNEVWTNGELKNYLELCELGLKVDLCVPVPQPFPNSTLVVSTRREPADFFFAGLVTVVSARLRAILEAFQVNAEFLALKTSPTQSKRSFSATSSTTWPASITGNRSTRKPRQKGRQGCQRLNISYSTTPKPRGNICLCWARLLGVISQIPRQSRMSFLV